MHQAAVYIRNHREARTVTSLSVISKMFKATRGLPQVHTCSLE